jgi:hypothetical protein
MDLAVVAALIKKERLCDRLQLELAYFYDESLMPHMSFGVPKNVPTIGSTIKKGKTWVISASGGVLFQPWELVQSPQENSKAAATMKKSLTARKDAWWWN